MNQTPRKANDTKQKKQMSIMSFFSTPKTKKVPTQEVTPESRKESPNSLKRNIPNEKTLESPTSKKNEEYLIKNIEKLNIQKSSSFSPTIGKENINNNKKKLENEKLNRKYDSDSDSEEDMPIIHKRKVY